eukprot:2817617-Pleurochrysis_carterae.AAC.2
MREDVKRCVLASWASRSFGRLSKAKSACKPTRRARAGARARASARMRAATEHENARASTVALAPTSSHASAKR